jgi:excisionase family DNA binding protein
MPVPVTRDSACPADTSAMPETRGPRRVFADVRRSLPPTVEAARHEPANEAQLVSNPAPSARGTTAPTADAAPASPSDEAPAHPALHPEVLTVDELADLLRVERKTAYAAVAAGEIPGARRIGRTIRIHRDAVLTWLAQGQGRVSHSRRSK